MNREQARWTEWVRNNRRRLIGVPVETAIEHVTAAGFKAAVLQEGQIRAAAGVWNVIPLFTRNGVVVRIG